MKTFFLALVLILAIGGWVDGYKKKCNEYSCGSCGNGYCEAFQGENCKNCPSDCGKCPSCDFCGDKKCGEGESSCNCSEDCGPCCIDGVCGEGETFDNCPKDCSGYITGAIFDAKHSGPIKTSPFNHFAEAEVTCHTRDSECGASDSVSGSVCSSGAFTFGPVRPGVWTCTASIEGFNSNSQSVVVTPGEPSVTPSFKIPLTRYPTTLSGRTWADESGFLPLAEVTCSKDGVTLHKRTSDQDGSFYFDDVAPGAYECHAEKDGYSSAQETILIEEGNGHSLHFSLHMKPAFLTGFVYDSETEQPVSGAQVSCKVDESGVELPTPPTHKDGSFLSGPSVLGSVTCTFSKSNYASSKYTGCLTHPGNKTIHVHLHPVAANIFLEVRDVAENFLVPNAYVRCLSSTQSFSRHTDAASVSFIDVDPDTFICYASAPGYAGANITFELAQGGRFSGVLLLTALLGEIVGCAKDAQGNTVAGVIVNCQNSRGVSSIGRANSTEEGNFGFRRVPGGTYRCYAVPFLGYSSPWVTVSVPRGGTGRVELQVSRVYGMITGTVKDHATRITIPGATITCSNGLQSYHTTTDGNGKYTVSEVLAGTYTCQASKGSWYVVGKTELGVTASFTEELNFSLDRA